MFMLFLICLAKKYPFESQLSVESETTRWEDEVFNESGEKKIFFAETETRKAKFDFEKENRSLSRALREFHEEKKRFESKLFEINQIRMNLSVVWTNFIQIDKEFAMDTFNEENNGQNLIFASQSLQDIVEFKYLIEELKEIRLNMEKTAENVSQQTAVYIKSRQIYFAKKQFLSDTLTFYRNMDKTQVSKCMAIDVANELIFLKGTVVLT